ncbi:MAG: SEC-C metal-binding domain-containing protein [Thermodesulfobacteriota bacterium]|nr:SEC-C metal-binding domain-containing protein [Thermodesulfobacteriota bacterium]
MAKIGRNAPCPCGSGKKYKKCCLPLQERSSSQQNISYSEADIDDLDMLSNSVADLIKDGELDEAEKVCHELLKHYPGQIDGIDRLAEVYEARGNNKMAAEYYRKAASFAQNNPGFDQEGIDWYLSKAKRLETEE